MEIAHSGKILCFRSKLYHQCKSDETGASETIHLTKLQYKSSCGRQPSSWKPREIATKDEVFH